MEHRNPRTGGRRVAALAVLALLAGLLPGMIGTAAAAAVRVMPLGDSITEGGDGDATYRYFLWHQLRAAGRDVDFVGTRTGVKEGAPRYADFDQHHQGVSGTRADQVAATIADRVRVKDPDVVLLHIGTNDLNQGQSNESTRSDIASIITKIRGVDPDTDILLAKIISRTGREAQTAALNEQIATLAPALDTARSRVVLVDQYTGFDPAVDTDDGVHPSESGDRKMADRWFAALDPLLAGGTPPPPPPPPSGVRVTAGLVGLYTFAEGGGATVADRSGAGTPLDLTIADPSRTQWLAGGGLAVRSATILTSAPASRLVAAVEASQATTLEAWVRPANLTQKGPANIAAVAKAYGNRSISLGQGTAKGAPTAVEGRVRTSSSATRGVAVTSPTGALTGALQHVVLVRTAAGAATLHVDGKVVRTTTASGSLDAWDATHRVVVANELGTKKAPWLGELHLVAVYDRALSASEIAQNRSAGPR